MSTSSPLDAFGPWLVEMVGAAVRDALAEAQPSELPPALVDRAQLARQLGVSPATVRRLETEGLPVLRVGDAPRYRVEDVLGWLRARTERSATPEEGAEVQPTFGSRIGQPGRIPTT